MLSLFVLHLNNIHQRKSFPPVEILVAEDDLDAAAMYTAALEPRGHKVIQTFDGQECLNIYQAKLARLRSNREASDKHPFDVVILDYKMPIVDGLQVAKRILNLDPNQRIIFASAYAKETLIVSVRELKQLIEVIQKPFDPEVLVNLIEDKAVVGKLEEINARLRKMDTADHEIDIDSLLSELVRIQRNGE